jgi:hypothetical protein
LSLIFIFLKIFGDDYKLLSSSWSTFLHYLIE